MSRALFIQNEKVDTIPRTPQISSNQFSFPAYSQKNTNYHLLPNYYTFYGIIKLIRYIWRKGVRYYSRGILNRKEDKIQSWRRAYRSLHRGLYRPETDYRKREAWRLKMHDPDCSECREKIHSNPAKTKTKVLEC